MDSLKVEGIFPIWQINIDKALSGNYFKYSDFIGDTVPDKPNANKKYGIKSRAVGPVELEALLLDDAGADEF